MRIAISPGRRRASFLRVLGIGCGVVALLLIGSCVYLALNFRRLSAEMAREMIMAVIEASDLPADQQARLTAQVDRVVEDFKARRVSFVQLGEIARHLAEGPFMPLAELEAAHRHFVGDSGMTVEEKETAALEFQRFSRAVAEGRVSHEDVRIVLRPYVSNAQAYGSPLSTSSRSDWEPPVFRIDVTAEERAALIASLEARASAVGVPAEPYQVDYAVLLSRSIDDVLAGRAAPSSVSPAVDFAEPTQAPEPVEEVVGWDPGDADPTER